MASTLHAACRRKRPVVQSTNLRPTCKRSHIASISTLAGFRTLVIKTIQTLPVAFFSLCAPSHFLRDFPGSGWRMTTECN